jgi:hypothetical protein
MKKPMNALTALQSEVIQKPINSKIFIEGPAGTGKTTAGVERMLHLMESGVSGDAIMVITPQRTLATPYVDGSNSFRSPSGGLVTCITLGGLAQRMVSLFWPLVAYQAGFIQPDSPPTFLTLETAQYYMAYLVRPLFQEGYFDSVTIDRNRLYSQIIDNLNKSAVVRFPYTEIGERLKSAWTGEPGQLRVYDDTQVCCTRFRQFCLENNLLDFSLQMDVFANYIWPLDYCYDYLIRTYRHLIVDNIEEDTPVAHDILANWLTQCSSALMIYDRDAGYRRFLGADPDNGYQLKDLCQEQYRFEDSLVSSSEIKELELHVIMRLNHQKTSPFSVDPRPALTHNTHRFFPEMLDWIAAEISELVHNEGIPPGEIAVLSPYLSDSLRFALVNRLEQLSVPTRSHRPSRSLRDEPATQCLFTLAALAHPEWGISRNKFDLAYALLYAIDGLDLVRSQMLSEIVLRYKDGVPTLTSFEQIVPEMQERITFLFGGRYETLRNWLLTNTHNQRGELDHFISLLFGEVLSQPGFGFHARYDAGEVTANLIESIHKFRRVVGVQLLKAGVPLGQEYLWMVHDGVIAAQYLGQWQTEVGDAVLLAPAYTFLMSNHPVSIQFWLDISSRGWSERLNQPLTHPFVLSRQWERDRQWTDVDEVEADQITLISLISGLLRRCRSKVYLGLSEFSEQGYEQRGPLLRVFQNILQRFSGEGM